MTYDIQQLEIYEVLKAAVEEGLEIVRDLQAQKKYIGTYFNFPSMSWFGSGLPSFSFSFMSEGPTDYKGAFREAPKENLKSWQAFWELAPKYTGLRRYYELQEDTLPPSDNNIFAFLTIQKLIDRYIHVSHMTEFDEQAFRPVYVEWERCVFFDELPFDVFVPLIYITFDSDRIDFDAGIGIQKLSEGIQLARIKKKSSSLSQYESVTGAATHALVLKDWLIPNANWIARRATLSSVEAFSNVIEKVDLFLAALRTTTGKETGYNQLVVAPHFWGDSWEAYLPDISVVSKKTYPDHFENGGWRQKPPVISNTECEESYNVYKSLLNNPSNKLLLATRRLNAAFLRSSEDDVILDITIGLESLLADDSRSEITYKLAVRLSSLSVLESFDEHSPAEVFELCKKIYDYRSAVVHGSHNIGKKRIVHLKSKPEPIPAVELGLSLLRYTIRIMARYSNLLDPKELDQHLLKFLMK